MNIDQIKAALISGAPTRKLAQVPTPEWASLGLPHVWAGELSGDELDEYDEAHQAKVYPTDDEGNLLPERVDHRGLRSILVSFGLCDEHGARASWTDAEISVLGKHSGAALDRVYDKIRELSGMKRGSLEQAAKNLPADQTANSG